MAQRDLHLTDLVMLGKPIEVVNPEHEGLAHDVSIGNLLGGASKYRLERVAALSLDTVAWDRQDGRAGWGQTRGKNEAVKLLRWNGKLCHSTRKERWSMYTLLG